MTRASRNRVSHHRRVLEKHFGHGLVGLFDPVTKEFNHEAVLRRRGGLDANGESMGTLHDYYIPHVLTYGTHILKQGAWDTFNDPPENLFEFVNKEGEMKSFNRYDTTALLYGWASALVEDDDDRTSSACFLSVFETITQLDILRRDVARLEDTWNHAFDALAFEPTLVMNDFAAAYE